MCLNNRSALALTLLRNNSFLSVALRNSSKLSNKTTTVSSHSSKYSPNKSRVQMSCRLNFPNNNNTFRNSSTNNNNSSLNSSTNNNNSSPNNNSQFNTKTRTWTSSRLNFILDIITYKRAHLLYSIKRKKTKKRKLLLSLLLSTAVAHMIIFLPLLNKSLRKVQKCWFMKLRLLTLKNSFRRMREILQMTWPKKWWPISTSCILIVLFSTGNVVGRMVLKTSHKENNIFSSFFEWSLTKVTWQCSVTSVSRRWSAIGMRVSWVPIRSFYQDKLQIRL